MNHSMRNHRSWDLNMVNICSAIWVQQSLPAGMGVSRGDKSALLLLGLMWANGWRSLRVSRQRCKLDGDTVCVSSVHSQLFLWGGSAEYRCSRGAAGETEAQSFWFYLLKSQNQRQRQTRLLVSKSSLLSSALLSLHKETSVPLYFLPVLFVTFGFTSLK